MTGQDIEEPKFEHWPTMRYSKATLGRLIAKGPEECTDEEFKFVLIRWGYLSNDELVVWKPHLTTEAAIKRLGGDEYFGLLDDMATIRKKKGTPHLWQTPEELEEARKRHEGEARLVFPEGMSPGDIKAMKRNYQEEKASGGSVKQRKAKRLAARKARKKNRSN